MIQDNCVYALEQVKLHLQGNPDPDDPIPPDQRIDSVIRAIKDHWERRVDRWDDYIPVTLKGIPQMDARILMTDRDRAIRALSFVKYDDKIILSLEFFRGFSWDIWLPCWAWFRVRNALNGALEDSHDEVKEKS